MSTGEQGAVAPTRREEILALAADLFWDKGYHAASMNDVADAVGMRKASLYHHIRTKEELLYEMSVESMHHMIDAAGRSTGADQLTRLRSLIVNHIEALLADRSKHATALTELRSLSPEQRDHVTELRSRYDRTIDEAVRAVQDSTGRWDGVPSRLVRLGLLGMLNWTVFWFHDEGPDSPADIATTFADILLGTEPPAPAPSRRRRT